MGSFKRLISVIKRNLWSNNEYNAHPKFTNEFSQYKSYKIGDFTYGNPTILDWGEGARLVIGKFCSIAEDVEIFLGGNHRIDWISTYPFSKIFPEASHVPGHPTTKGDVEIGNDVWIGRGAVIMSGVSIGNGAVIGTRAVVTKNVAPYSIVAGNPARLIRYRFDEKEIECLQKINWWDWPINEILGQSDILLSEDIANLTAQRCNQKKTSNQLPQ